MAKKIIGGLNGNATVAGHNMDIATWDGTIAQQVDDVTSYSDTNWGSSHGSGVLKMAVTTTGFLKYSAATTSPNMTTLDGEPVACVFTATTGCSYAGNFVISSFQIAHRKVSGGIGAVMQMISSGSVTETWQETGS